MNIDRSEITDETFGSQGSRLFALFLREFAVTSEVEERVLRAGDKPRNVHIITYSLKGSPAGLAVHQVLLPANYYPDSTDSWLEEPARLYPLTAFARAYRESTGATRDSVVLTEFATEDCVALIQRAARQVCDTPTASLWHQLLGDLEHTGAFAMLSYASNHALKTQATDAAQAGEPLTVQGIASTLQCSWAALFEELNHIQSLTASSRSELAKTACQNLMAPWLGRPDEENFRNALKKFVRLVGDFDGDGLRVAMAVKYAYFSVHTLTLQEWHGLLINVVQEAPVAEAVA